MATKNIIPGWFRPRRLLIVQFRQIGDALMCAPAVRELRRAFPDLRIDFLAEPSAAKVLSTNPHIDNIVLSNPEDGAMGFMGLLWKIRSRRYDLVIDFLANPRSALVARLSGAKFTLSYAGRRRSRLYTHRVKERGDYSGAQKLSLLRALNIEGGGLRPEFRPQVETRGRISRWLDKTGLAERPFIIIDPTHRRITRRYNRYGEVARLLGERYGVKCVFIWGPGEEEEARGICALAGGDHVVAPVTDLMELGALIERAALLAGNDSAPRHIAAALGVPTVITVGATRPENWTLPEPIHKTVALDIDCRPCSSNKCKRAEVECMTRLEPEKVVNEIASLMKL